VLVLLVPDPTTATGDLNTDSLLFISGNRLDCAATIRGFVTLLELRCLARIQTRRRLSKVGVVKAAPLAHALIVAPTRLVLPLLLGV